MIVTVRIKYDLASLGQPYYLDYLALFCIATLDFYHVWERVMFQFYVLRSSVCF